MIPVMRLPSAVWLSALIFQRADFRKGACSVFLSTMLAGSLTIAAEPSKPVSRDKVSSEVQARLAKHLDSNDGSCIPYPWKDLEERVLAWPAKKLPLVVYGSLLARESASRTIKTGTSEGSAPVLVLGARRVFNYVMPKEALARYQTPPNSRNGAALNALYTKSKSDVLNGKLMMVRSEDIPALRKREYGYDLCPVSCVPWYDREGEPFSAYVLSARNGREFRRRVADDSLLPNLEYARLCRLGARTVSSDFLAFYLETTFLADRTTTLFEWERLHPEFAREPEAK